jgi:enoyl-CoA hydratase/carnithine racemase
MKPHTNSKIISEIDNGWLTIWFNSIENRNALSEGLISDLKNLLNKTKINHTIRGNYFKRERRLLLFWRRLKKL